MIGISNRQVSRLCAEIDERVPTFLERPIEGDWPYLWIDATYMKVHEAGRIVSTFIATAFAQDHADAARARWHQVADLVRPKLPKLAALLDEAEEDVLTYMSFPKKHRAKIHSTNPLNASTARSSAAPRWSASFPTRRRSPAWWAPSCWGRTTMVPAACPLYDPRNYRTDAR
jgi:transposase-like protein